MNVSPRQRSGGRIGSFCCCAAGRRFCKDPLQQMASSALRVLASILGGAEARHPCRGFGSSHPAPLSCASLARSTLEKGRDSNSLLGSEGFRIGFAKHIVGVAKFQAGSGHKLSKITRFDNYFVMKLLKLSRISSGIFEVKLFPQMLLYKFGRSSALGISWNFGG